MLEELIRRSSKGSVIARPEVKLGVLIALEAGALPATVATVLGCPVKTVRNWADRFKRGGRAAILRGPGRRPVVTKGVVDVIRAALGRKPWELGYKRSHWSAELIRRYLESHHGIAMSRGSVWNAMTRAGYRFQRGAGARTDAELRARAAARSMVQKSMHSGDGETWFLDEAIFEVESPGRGHWVPETKVKTEAIYFSGPRRGCLMFGALRDDGLFLMEEKAATTAAAMVEFLDLVALHRRGGGPMRIIWDNATCHTARVTKERATADLGWEITFLPPYCSEFNPIEGVWELLRRDCSATAVDVEALRACLRDRSAPWRAPNEELAGIIAASTTPGLRRPSRLGATHRAYSRASAQLLFGDDGDGKEDA